MVPSLIEMTKGRLREFCREPSALFFVLLMPVIWLLLLGNAFDRTGATLPLGLALDDSRVAMKVRTVLAADGGFAITEGSRPELDRQQWRKKLAVIVSVSGGRVGYAFDPGHPEGRIARDAVDRRLQAAFGAQPAVATWDEAVTVPGNRYVDYLIPGLIALSLFTSCLFGSGMTLVAGRREKLLKLYRATPMSPVAYLGSHYLGRMLVMLLETAVVLTAGVLLFRFAPQGGFLGLALFAGLATAAFTGLAIFCGCRLRNTSTYNSLCNLVTITMVLLSGIWFSRDHLPDWLATFAAYLPLSLAADGMRAILLGGQTLASQAPLALGLGAYAVAFLFLGARLFRWN